MNPSKFDTIERIYKSPCYQDQLHSSYYLLEPSSSQPNQWMYLPQTFPCAKYLSSLNVNDIDSQCWKCLSKWIDHEKLQTNSCIFKPCTDDNESITICNPGPCSDLTTEYQNDNVPTVNKLSSFRDCILAHSSQCSPQLISAFDPNQTILTQRNNSQQSQDTLLMGMTSPPSHPIISGMTPLNLSMNPK